MNGTMYSQNASNGYYTGHTPNYSHSTFTPNSYVNQAYPCDQNNNNNSNNNNNNMYPAHQSSQMSPISYSQYENNNYQPAMNGNVYNFQNMEPLSKKYYDDIHNQYRASSSSHQQDNSTFTNMSNFHIQHASNNGPSINPTRHVTPIIGNDQHEHRFYVISATDTNNSSTPVEFPTATPSTFTPVALNDNFVSVQPANDTDPSLDYLNYSLESLIQRLVPTDTYIPKQSFIYPMLLCSRAHIRPSLLFNQLARSTIKSIENLTYQQSVQIMNNLLYVLSQWTRAFPYDFRNNELMLQFEDLLNKIICFEPKLQSDTYYIRKKLRSKLKALDHYEEYIRQLNKKALYNLSQYALVTDIMNECPTAILFAQQLTHIELDRLKPVGAEEFVQYFIMKLASEEERANPNKKSNIDEFKSKTYIHDKKLTFCLEAYIQWFNRLTFFVTTEIVKHTQRRSRVRLINYFIDAAYECFRLHNFNSMIGILGGLNMQPVRRLKRTWEKIQLDKFQQLEQYVNVSKNFATYRLVLKAAKEDAENYGWSIDHIVIPFTSIILQDVYFIKTHSHDYTTTGGVNLKKYYSMAKFLTDEFMQCKQSKCSFERNDVIINYIITSPTFNEDSLMLASFECEPPATYNEKEKLRILQKSVN